MSSEWRSYSLGDLAKFKYGKFLAKSELDDSGFDVFSGYGVVGYLPTYQFNDPQLLIVCRGEGGTGDVKMSPPKCSITNLSIVISPCEEKVAKKFLYWSLKACDTHRLRTGSAQAQIVIGSLEKLRLVIPTDRAEQDYLAGILSALDDRITLLRETNATLEAIAQALFKSWFVDFDPVHAKQQGIAPEGMDDATAALFPDSFEESELGLVPRGWRVSRLTDEVERITKGTTPTTIKRPFVACGINFVKAESMTDDGQFIPEKFAYIDDETHELLKRSQLKAGDVLISIAGTIGRLAVMTEEFLPANTNQAVALIRPFQDRFPSGLISRFLQRTESQQLMGERVVQAVQANLSLGSLSDMKVVVAPAEVINKLYSAGLAQIDASKVMNASRIRTLATLRDTLLPRLISGQLRLPESVPSATCTEA